MEKSIKQLLLSPIVLALCLTAADSRAAETKERAIKFGYSVHEVHPLGKGATRFSDLIAEKSGGKIKVKNYPATALGSETQMISATQGGVQEIVGVSSAPIASLVKQFALFDLPFLFSDGKEADAVLDGPVGQQLLGKLTDKGLIGLCFWENGFRHVTNAKRPVNKPEDVQGLKIRTMQNPVYIDAFNALGANAVPMPWPEVYAALETKAIDGQENPYAIIQANKLDEVQKYLTATKHSYSPYVVMAGKKFWDKLTPDEQKILQDSCLEARDYQRTVSREEDIKILADLKEKGMVITELPPEERTRLQQLLKPVAEKYTQQVGEDLVKQTYAEIEKVRTRN